MLRRHLIEAAASTALFACAGAPRSPAREAASSGPAAAPVVPRAPLAPFDEATFVDRLDRVRALCRDAGATHAFVTSGTTNFAYLAGAPMDRSERLIALVVPVAGEPVVVAPSFDVERVRRTIRVRAALHGWEESRNPFDVLREALAPSGSAAPAAFLVEPHSEYGTSMGLAGAFPSARLVDGTTAFGSLRVVKSADEIARIRRAIAFTHEAFEKAFAELRPGVRDRDVSASIARAFEASGVQGYALVQFGALSALPHGRPAGDKLEVGTAVLIDGGCRVDGYWSDVTRTRWFGGAPPAEFARVSDVVRDAQQAGIARAKAGVPAEEVDRAARAVITRAGYGEYFTHRTGHGLGMDDHEAIYMVEGNRTPLVQGCVFTVEPGIYLPGRFGVRLEDDVLCNAAAAEVLTGA